MSTSQSTAARPVRLAFVGAGGIAKTHAQAAASIPGHARVVAAADPSAEALASFAGDADTVTAESFDELLGLRSRGEIEFDAVVLCAPPSVREPVIRAVLEAGLNVLVEKPIARTGEEAAGLVALAERFPTQVCAVGYCHRFTPALVAMKDRARAGEIGRITRFENVFAFHHPPMSERWFSDPAVSGGGSFVDTGCHSLDLFQFLVGAPEVVGATADFDWEGRGDSSASVLVRAADGPSAGAAGVILSGWLEPARFRVRLVGTEGALSYDFDDPPRLDLTKPDGASEVISVAPHDERFAGQLEAFCSAISGHAGAGDAGLASFKEAEIVAKAVDAAHSAVRLYNHAAMSRLSSVASG